MANLSGCIRKQLGLQSPRAMGKRLDALSDTVVDFKGSFVSMTKPIPTWVFKRTAFDLQHEMAGVTGEYHRKHGKDLKQIMKKKRKFVPSVASAAYRDPAPTEDTVVAVQKRLDYLRLTIGDNTHKGSLIKPMLLPDDVTNRDTPADFRLAHLARDISHREKMLKEKTYNPNKRGRSVPCGITMNADYEEILLYDQFPQSSMMSEMQQSYFPRAIETLVEMGTGKDLRWIHQKDKSYDYRESMLRQEIAMGKRKF